MWDRWVVVYVAFSADINHFIRFSVNNDLLTVNLRVLKYLLIVGLGVIYPLYYPHRSFLLLL